MYTITVSQEIKEACLVFAGVAVYAEVKTPTSDYERTKMGLETTHILAIVNGYNGRQGLQEAAEMIQDLLKHYTGSDGGSIAYF